MLKQWRPKKKNGNRAESADHGLTHPGIVRFKHQHPFSESYIIRRSNPLFAEDGHLRSLDESRLQKNWPSPNDDRQRKLHVQTWCSIVCPRHLSTCCVCKPVFIYCDHCGTSGRNSPELERKKTRRPINGIDAVNQLKTSLLVHTPSMAMANSKIQSLVGVDQHHQQIKEPNGNRYEHAEVPIDASHRFKDHIYEQLIPLEELESIQLNNEKQQQQMEFYVNTEFVSEITVQRKNNPFGKTSTEEIRKSTGRQTQEDGISRKHQFVSHLDTKESRNSSRGYRRVAPSGEETSSDCDERDSLDSLGIDEGMFTPEYTDTSSASTSKLRTSNSGRGNADAMLAQNDEDIVNEAIKDLYQKLAKNRHHVVLFQAMKSSGSQNSLSEYDVPTETMSNQMRRSYASLLEEESKRTNSPPNTYYDNILLRSSPANTIAEGGQSTRMAGNVWQKGNARVPAAGNEQLAKSNVPLAVTTTTRNTTTAANSAGEQLGEQSVAETSKRTNQENQRNRLPKRDYKEALKIIFTTAIGLIAFGIITALSLRLQ